MSGLVQLFAVKTVVEVLTPCKVQKQIRLRWGSDLSREGGSLGYPGQWHEDKKLDREMFERLVKAGNDNYGSGTHWLEEREV